MSNNLAEQRDRETRSPRLAPYLEEADQIASAALYVAELDRTSGIDRAEAIGSYILERFYGGSIETWRSRQKNKNNSLHRIAAHPECPLSKSTLYRAVCVSVTKRAHPSVSTLKHISANHIATIAALPPEAQLEWLERASAEAWSVDQLRERLTDDRRASGDHRGRRPDPALKRAKSGVRTAIGKLEHAVQELCALPLDDDDSEVQELAATIQALGSMLREHRAAPRSESHATLTLVDSAEGMGTAILPQAARKASSGDYFAR